MSYDHSWYGWRERNGENDTGLITMEADGKPIDLYSERGNIAAALGLDELDKTVGDILVKAINASARKVMAKMREDVSNRYALEDESMLKRPKDGGLRKKKLGKGTDAGILLISKGPALEMADYDISPRPDSHQDGEPKQVKGRVLEASSKKNLERKGAKAFLARFESRHVAVVQRRPGELYTFAGATKRLAKHQAATPKRGWQPDLTRIKKLLAPSVPSLFGNEEVMDGVGEMLREIMDKEVQKRIVKELKARE